jgi:hypothetical protein
MRTLLEGTAPVRGAVCFEKQDRPGDVPRLYSICGTMRIEPPKTKRPADWPWRWPINGSKTMVRCGLAKLERGTIKR